MAPVRGHPGGEERRGLVEKPANCLDKTPATLATLPLMSPRALGEQSEFGEFLALAVYQVLNDELGLDRGGVGIGVPWNLAI